MKLHSCRKAKHSIDGSKKTNELNPSTGKKDDFSESSFDSDDESQETESKQSDDFFPVPSSGEKNDSQKVDMLKVLFKLLTYTFKTLLSFNSFFLKTYIKIIKYTLIQQNFPVVLDIENTSNHLVFELFEADAQNNLSANSLINVGFVLYYI